MDNLSGGNVRTALEFLQSFVGSGHVDTAKILRTVDESGSYIVPRHEFLRAIIYGDNEYFDPQASPLVNLLDISSQDGREHFLLPILLAFLTQRHNKRSGEGFVSLDDLTQHAQRLGFQPEQIKYALDRADSRRLLERSPRFEQSSTDVRVRITTSGAYSVQRLLGLSVYVDAVVVDTPIVDESWRSRIQDEKEISDRLKRAMWLRAYLDKHWHALVGSGTEFDWPNVSRALLEEITHLGRSVDPENWP